MHVNHHDTNGEGEREREREREMDTHGIFTPFVAN